METEVAGANAQGPSMAYLSHTKVRGYLKVVPEGPHIQQRIWSLGDLNSGDGVVNGYRAKVSNQMPGGATGEKATIIFGDFSQIMIGEWGGLYLESNPWIKQGEGIIRMHVEALADVAIRHPESFCILKNIDLSKFPEIQNLGPGSVDGPTERGSIRRRGRGGADE